MLDWKTAQKPIIALSPMADMTDSAFCRIAKRCGASIMFREMVSADGVVHENDKTLAMASFLPEERPIVQQLFGKDPGKLAAALKIIDEMFSPDGFDINMGCPASKIISGSSGAALMREPETAADLVRAAKAATSKPVSVKTRLGWDDPKEILEFLPLLEDAGADLVTIHGRTKKQGYAGQADWVAVGRARQRVKIPVLVNGDIFSATDAAKALDISGCAGALIARGALGNPWIFRQTAELLAGRTPTDVTIEERLSLVREHAALHAAAHGGNLTTFRKHLLLYFKGTPGVKRLRERLAQVSTIGELEEVLAIFEDAEMLRC